MHATNTFPVDRHPQYRHYPTTIRSIVSGIIIEVEKNPHQIVWWILSRGATMMSDRIMFLSAITGRSIILALRAALSPSVLWRTRRCGLPTDMILQKKPTRFAKSNPKEIVLLVHKENPALYLQ
jgi:hypothetical protein